jgi:hypothetical protein
MAERSDEAVSRLVITFANSRPVELTDLIASLNAVAALFQRFTARSGIEADAAARLYVHEIAMHGGTIKVSLSDDTD